RSGAALRRGFAPSEPTKQQFRRARYGARLLRSKLMFAGRVELSRSHMQETLSLYDPAIHQPFVHQYPQLVCQPNLGIVLFCLGLPDQAPASSNAAIAEPRIAPLRGAAAIVQSV